MAILDLTEKLINEHGSAVILRERLLLLKDQCAALENELIVCRNEITSLTEKTKKLESENQNLKLQNSALKEQLKGVHNSNPHGYVCDHCGSPKLKRIGNKPDPIFGDLGIKQAVFKCEVCGKESAFTPESSK